MPTQRENSEVSFVATFVAVAVTDWPAISVAPNDVLNAALPAALVVTVVKPR